jgi:hypothetical protein
MIRAHTKVDCSDEPSEKDEKKVFIAQVNPEKMEYEFGYKSLNSSDKSKSSEDEMGTNAVGTPAPPPGFQGYKSIGMTFDFLADATGILPIPEDLKGEFEGEGGGLFGGKPPSIRKHLDRLKNVIYGENKEIHGPPFLSILWGKVMPDSKNGEDAQGGVFKCTLDKCKIEVLLFSASGEPIKAKISITVNSLVSPDAWQTRNSPDVTHSIPVQYGDKMTVHCKEIYGRYDSNICAAIADYNGLVDWDLQEHVGKKLTFPSIHMLNELYLENWKDLEKQQKKEEAEAAEETHFERKVKLIGRNRAKQYFKTFGYDPDEPYSTWRARRDETKGLA